MRFFYLLFNGWIPLSETKKEQGIMGNVVKNELSTIDWLKVQLEGEPLRISKKRVQDILGLVDAIAVTQSMHKKNCACHICHAMANLRYN